MPWLSSLLCSVPARFVTQGHLPLLYPDLYVHVLQQVTIIHKSNVLSITDGLFRETVRAVPGLPEVQGRFDDVTIQEQLVDSAVYR